jgi:hypothetical protein
MLCTGCTSFAAFSVCKCVNQQCLCAAFVVSKGCQSSMLSQRLRSCCTVAFAVVVTFCHGCCHAAGVAGQPPQHVCSIPLGCLSVQAATSRSQPGAQQQQQQQQQQQLLLQAADAILAAHASQVTPVIDTYKQQLSSSSPITTQQQQQPGQTQPVVIGTGGTITTLAALQQQLPAYSHAHVHMSRLSQADVQGLLQQLVLEEGRERCVGQTSTAKMLANHLVFCLSASLLFVGLQNTGFRLQT